RKTEPPPCKLSEETVRRGETEEARGPWKGHGAHEHGDGWDAAFAEKSWELVGCHHEVDDFFFSSRRRHTRSKRDWSSDVCSSDLGRFATGAIAIPTRDSAIADFWEQSVPRRQSHRLRVGRITVSHRRCEEVAASR